MRINWTVRFRNKVWLAEFLAFIVSTIFHLLSQFDVAPVITENAVMQVINSALMVLSLMGVIVDPTTSGQSDSSRALSYTEPN